MWMTPRSMTQHNGSKYNPVLQMIKTVSQNFLQLNKSEAIIIDPDSSTKHFPSTYAIGLLASKPNAEM